MKKVLVVVLLMLVSGLLLTGCREYGPPPSGYVGPAPDDYRHRHDPDNDVPPPPPPGAVGPANGRDYPDYPDSPPPPPPGAVGPARRY